MFRLRTSLPAVCALVIITGCGGGGGGGNGLDLSRVHVEAELVVGDLHEHWFEAEIPQAQKEVQEHPRHPAEWVPDHIAHDDHDRTSTTGHLRHVMPASENQTSRERERPVLTNRDNSTLRVVGPTDRSLTLSAREKPSVELAIGR